jgi:hypothetical protein
MFKGTPKIYEFRGTSRMNNSLRPPVRAFNISPGHQFHVQKTNQVIKFLNEKMLLFLQKKRSMKKYYSLLFTAGLIAFVFVMAGFGGDDLKNSSGAPAGNTNSPGDGQNCTHCMGGTATAVTGWITSDIPASGYVPGVTYTITATATGSGNKGFQISPQTLAGNLIGTLTAGTGNKLVGSGKYVTHSSAVNTNPAVWHFQWKAPTVGVASVTFYGAFAVTQSGTKTTTMTVLENTVGIPERNGMEWSCYPNPVRDKIFVKFSSLQTGKISVDLVSLNGNAGRNLLSTEISMEEQSLEIPVSQPAGLYLLRITGENGTQCKKIIVE